MVPAVDSVVNDGAFSPIKGIRKFLALVFPVGLSELPARVNKFVYENISFTKLNCSVNAILRPIHLKELPVNQTK